MKLGSKDQRMGIKAKEVLAYLLIYLPAIN